MPRRIEHPALFSLRVTVVWVIVFGFISGWEIGNMLYDLVVSLMVAQ